VATTAARLLMGKHKPAYAVHRFRRSRHHRECGQGEAHGARKNKLCRYHSGARAVARGTRQGPPAKNAVRLVEEAVKGMLPKTKLGDAMGRKLKVYKGDKHPHVAQKPAKLEVA
jgi:large subunit ribosomal protein L13